MGATAPAPPSNVKPSSKSGCGCATALLLGLVLVAVLGLGAYVVAGPYLTLNGLQKAIAAGDTQALANYVDFATLRENLKQQINARANQSANAAFQNPIVSRLMGGFATSVTEAAVDSLVTPAGLNGLLLGAALWTNNSTDSPGVTLQQRIENAQRSFESLSTFTVTFAAATGSQIAIVLTRDGLSWRLSNVRLPPSGPLPPPR